MRSTVMHFTTQMDNWRTVSMTGYLVNICTRVNYYIADKAKLHSILNEPL